MSKKNTPLINAFDFQKNSSLEKEIYGRWRPDIRAENDTSETITIYETIGDDGWGGGFTAKRMSSALKSAAGKDVIVSINSPGGDFFEGAAIYNLLKQYSGKVTVKILGLAASAASIIAMAGDVIQISEIGFLMIHDVWALVIGNRNDLRKAADTFEKFDAAIADVYSARTGYDRADIVEMMDNDTWINASEAIEKGFADELLPEKLIEDSGNEKKTKAMARRSLEAAMAKLGFSRKEREEIFQKAGLRDAAGPAARDAGEGEDEAWQELIDVMKN